MIKKKILVVDDEPELVKAVQIRLTRAGYEVLSAYDGQEGLEKAKKETPDLILLDISMPEINGYQALQRLKGESQTKSIPVIMITANSQLEDVARAINLGAEEYIVKPFDYIAMLGKIKKALEV